MPEPLSIFSARFLYFETTEKPTESLAKTKLNQIGNSISTSIFLALYSRGFYIKGKLNHISHDQTKSRHNQFISAGLLRKIYKYSFQNDYIIMIFHETVNLLIEVLLILFPSDIIHECNIFYDYLHILLKEKVCLNKMLDAIPMKSEKQTLKNLENSEQLENNIVAVKVLPEKSSIEILSESKEAEHSLKLLDSITFPDHSSSFDETTSEEILDSCYLSDSSNNNNHRFHRKLEYHNPVEIKKQTRNSYENSEMFIETKVFKTKKSSLFYDEQPDTLNSLDSIETFYQNSENNFNFSQSPQSVDEIDHFERVWNESYDQRDSLSSIPNVTDDYAKFTNENQNQKLLESLYSIEENKPDTLQLFTADGTYFDNNYWEVSNSSKSKICFFKNNGDDYSSKSENRNSFCWPDFLKHESKFTSSILVEMPFLIRELNNNWSLIDRQSKKDSIDENKSQKFLEWNEKVDRLKYDPITKSFKLNENGSLVIYCCRQIYMENEKY